MLNDEVVMKENELAQLQMNLEKMKLTRSEWSRGNSTYYNQSDTGTIKTQLDTITQELEDEKKKTDTVL